MLAATLAGTCAHACSRRVSGGSACHACMFASQSMGRGCGNPWVPARSAFVHRYLPMGLWLRRVRWPRKATDPRGVGWCGFLPGAFDLGRFFVSWRLGVTILHSFWHPCRGARIEGGDAFRWCRFAQPPATMLHPSGMRSRWRLRRWHAPREGTRPTEGGASHSAGTALPHEWGRARDGGCRRHPRV